MRRSLMAAIVLAAGLCVNHPPEADAKQVRKIYVSTAGNDRGDGSKKSPLRSVAEALRRAETPAYAETEIVPAPGRYHTDRTLEIGAGKGSGKLVLKGEMPGTAILSGGRKVPRGAVRKVSDPNVLKRLQPEMRRHIYEIDLRRAGIESNGLRPSGFGRPSLPAWTELFEDGGAPAHRMIGDLQGKIYADILFDRQAGKNNGIRNCRIYNVGAGGISLGGGSRATLERSGNFVENCRIHDFNRIEKSYRAGIWVDGTGCRITKCDIYNAPSMAILFHGNDHLIEKCDITNVCGEVDDQGAIYYGRDASERGHDITYRNNIFADCPVAVHIDNRMQGWGSNMVAKDGIIDQRLQRVRYKEPPYSTAYPELTSYWDENPTYPHRNKLEGNLFYKVGNLLNGRSEWAEFVNNRVTNTDPGFVDADDPLKGFRAGAAVFSHIKDFPAIPFDEIGCSLPADDSDNKP